MGRVRVAWWWVRAAVAFLAVVAAVVVIWVVAMVARAVYGPLMHNGRWPWEDDGDAA